MNKYFKILIINVSLVVLLAGCATMKLIKDSNDSWKYSKFSSKLPVGWVKYKAPGYILALTRDGQYLQIIKMGKTKTGKKLPNTKRKITEDLLLQELAQIMIDEITLTDGITAFGLISQKPENIGGMEAFRLEFTYSNTDLVNYHGIIYGFVFKRKYYEIEYSAMKQHYHAKSVNAFDNFIVNFKVNM